MSDMQPASQSLSPVIRSGTRLLALIGESPERVNPYLINTSLRERGLLGHFIAVPVQASADGLEAVINGLRQMENFAGAVIGIPHRSAMLPLLDKLTPDARMVGAVDVIRREADGRLTGGLINGESLIAGLSSRGQSVAGTTCLLRGAGANGTAVAFALARHGCRRLILQSRSEARAGSLAEALDSHWRTIEVLLDMPADSSCDLAVNASTVGQIATDPLPLPMPLLERTGFVADTVVADAPTALAAAASQAGRPILSGQDIQREQIRLLIDFMGV